MHSLLKINGKYSFAFVVWPSAAQRLLSPCLYANKRMRRFMQKFHFFPPSTTGLPNLARDVYVSFYLFRLSPMAVGIGPIGLPPPISRGGCRKSLADYVSNSLALFFFAGEPESEHAFGHFINLSVHQRNDSMRSVDKSALAFPLQWVAVCHTPPGFPPCGIVMKNWWKSWGFRFYSPIAPSEISLTETIRRTN